MTYKLKAIGRAFAAVLAIGACSAVGATAAEFHSEVSHTELRGEQHAGESTVTFSFGSFKCRVKYSGTESSATYTTIRATPTYSECSAFGFINPKIDTNGCVFVFHADPSTTSIDCPIGQVITVTLFNCWITTGTQGPFSGVTYTNLGSGSSRDITIDASISGVKYTQHSKSFPGCTNGTFSDASYTSSTTFRAFDTSGAQKGIWVQ